MATNDESVSLTYKHSKLVALRNLSHDLLREKFEDFPRLEESQQLLHLLGARLHIRNLGCPLKHQIHHIEDVARKTRNVRALDKF